jgi:MFS family permease
MLLLAPFIITYRFIDPYNIFFWAGVFAMYFQIGCLYGPAFGTIQDLAPSNKRGIVVGFAVLLIQICGAALGAVTAGLMIDVFTKYGFSQPYSITLLIFTAISLLAIPIFVFAGRRFERDRQKMREL